MSPDALLGAALAVLLALASALWKLASMLAEIRSEVRHNGGGSLKDKIHTIGGSVDQIKVTLAENGEHLTRVDERVTEHRRRNDAAAIALREHLDKKLDALADREKP